MRSLAGTLLGLMALVALVVVPGVQAQDVESEPLGPGERFSHTFEVAGEAQYHCHPHPRMEGAILITAADGSPAKTHIVEIVEPSGDAQSWGFAPASLTIKAGDTVEWVNKGKNDHLIMAWVGEDASAMQHDHGGHDHMDTHESPAGGALPIVVLALASIAAAARRHA